MEEKIIQEEEPKLPKLPEKLQLKFENLEQDWHTFTQSSSKTKPPTTVHKYNAIDSSSIKHQMTLLESSPRHLMSSLQQQAKIKGRTSPLFSSPRVITASGEVWWVRENELAQEEVRRRERKAAIESRKMRGRRLFEEEDEMGFDGDDEIKSVCTEICEYGSFSGGGETGEGKQGMLCFGTGEGDSENLEREVGVVKNVNGEMKVKEGKGGVLKWDGVRNVFVKVCFVIALLAFVIGITGSIGDGFGGGGKVFVMPT